MADDYIVAYGRSMHLVDITPELAREWLATLPASAKPDPGKVARYAAMMRAGTWRLQPLPVIFRRGQLHSSRHRLAAVIEADMTVQMYCNDDSCPR
jgi:hypothetical protein